MNAKLLWDEPENLQKLKAKNREAVRAFILDQQEKIFRICLGFVHNKEDAEDLTQDVFMEIFKNIDKFRGASLLSTWVYRICYTRALNKIKKNKWQKWMQSFDSVIGLSVTKEEPETPETIYQHSEERRLLHDGLDKLPPTQRTAFVLHNYEGLKYQEIADIMQVSVSSVESLLFRAKKNLKKYLVELMF